MNLSEAFNYNFTLVQYAELALRIIVACVCGAVIGFERSKRLKEAGLRTHLIVCCASALMMIVSKYGFADLSGPGDILLLGTKGADPARIAAQVISGVSFIGAGVIFHHKDNSVKGLTTAAGLWATAGIGLTIGAGMYGIGVFTTIVIAIIQTMMHKYAISMDNISTIKVGFKIRNTEQARQSVQDYLTTKKAEVVESEIEIDDGYASYKLTLKMTEEITIEELNGFFTSNDDIKAVTCSSIN